MSVPGTATSTVPMSVSPIERPEAIWTIAPETMAPAIAPSRAPTIPAQKRSGMNTVKCHRAMPTVNQTTAAISAPLPSSTPPVLSPAALLAAAPRFALGLGAVALGGGGRGLRLRGGVGAVGPVHVGGLNVGRGLLGHGHRRPGGRRCRCGRFRPRVAQLRHHVVLGERGQ